jgi:hypothetical protein
MMVDGTRMRSRNEPCWTTLTTDQIDMLVNIVTEDHGSVLTRQQFNDIVLMLSEDIAGLEMLTPTQRNQLLRKLWSRYQRSNDDLQRN